MKKKRKRRTPKLTSEELEKKLINFFNRSPKERVYAKQVAGLLKIGNAKDSIEHVLHKLLRENFLTTTRSGKFRLNKSNQEQGKKHHNSRKDRRRSPSKEEAIVVGTIDQTRNGDGYLICENWEEEKDIFIPAKRLKTAINGDQVKVRWFMRRNRPEGEVLQIISRKTEYFTGTLVVTPHLSFVILDDTKLKFDIEIAPSKMGEASAGDKVVVAVLHWPETKKGNPKGQVVSVLGNAGSNDAEMQAILVKHGFNLAFPKEVLAESEKISIELDEAEIAKRRDFRDTLTFTIDPLTAKDFDDALSIKLLENGNYEIGVHIADVTHYVRPNSALDKEASKRTTSVYLVDRALPMLPEKLSNGVCSLRPHEEKFTFSAVFEFTPKGKVVDEWFGKTVILSDRRFTYEEAQQGLETGEGEYAEELKLLNKFAHLLRKERFKKGSINFETPEVRFELDEEGTPLAMYPKIRKDAHMLVEDFMLLANKRVGYFMSQVTEKVNKNIPFIYRIHDLPNMEKVQDYALFAKELGYTVKADREEQVAYAISKLLKEAANKPEADILQQMAIRTMAKANYSSDNIGHYGLAFETYSHFTSPIRRYADVLAHRILFDYLSGEKKFIAKTALETHCRHIANRERKAMEAERESIKYKQTEYMQNHVGQEFEGVISGMTERGIFVELKRNYCEGMVKFDRMYDNFDLSNHKTSIKSATRSYRMGDTVWVKILNVDLQARRIEMELLDEREIEGYTVTESLDEEKIVEIKELNKSVSKLLSQISDAYKKSHVKAVADEAQQHWYYDLSSTAIHKNKPLIIGYNYEAKRGQSYQPAMRVPNSSILSSKALKVKDLVPFLEDYLGADNWQQAVLSNFCFFRSRFEKQINAEDIELTLPIFKEFVELIQPSCIIILSAKVRDYSIKKQLIANAQEHYVSLSKRGAWTCAKGQWLDTETPVYVLPNWGRGVPLDSIHEAWAWAFDKA